MQNSNDFSRDGNSVGGDMAVSEAANIAIDTSRTQVTNRFSMSMIKDANENEHMYCCFILFQRPK